MLQNLTGWHALIILAIVLLVFGSTKLPALARSVGQSLRILKEETHEEMVEAAARTRTEAAASATQLDATAIADEPRGTGTASTDRLAS
ncbi:twin-arginine translocase TatA/TatE family subunit [Tomitella gaofuii]|uniref:twin-arginine translocase TatA/TatE family subunit n=1 Tax=Tomitella gaofuii TaxID=2760083 RepID=UPI0015F83A53|nr:twin-arginine translocase TatA/TatE family subunit [Tomitella gaofuii]